MSTVYIYGLFDPRNMELRYIGKTKDLKDRLRNHLRLVNDTRCKDHHNYRWIRQLLDEGLEPSIEALEEVSVDSWRDAEQTWIAECRKFGVRLTNMTKGGDSFPDGYVPHNKGGTISEWQKSRIREYNLNKKVSDETRQKQRESHLGKTLPREQVRKIAEANRGKVMSPEARKKISEAHKGMTISEETRQKLIQWGKGKKLTEEHRRKIAEAGKGRKQTEETKEKLRQIHLGKKYPEEFGKKISERQRGRKLTEEHKAKIREGNKRNWTKRKSKANEN